MTKILATELGSKLINRMRNFDGNLRVDYYKLITPKVGVLTMDQHMDEFCYIDFEDAVNNMTTEGVLHVYLESEYFSEEKHFAIIRQGDYFLMELVWEECL